MENIDKQFEEWMRQRHLKSCPECLKVGKAKLMDCEVVAVMLLREFVKQ